MPRYRAGISPKQERFAKEYVKNGGNGTQAALKVYDVKNENVATNIATENVGKPNVQQRIKTLQGMFVDDSFNLYQIQKEILNKTKDKPKYFELANKIINKTLDRAGFMPVAKTETKSITARYIINRGEDKETV